MSNICIRHMESAADKSAFRDLNLAWIEEHFEVEDKDRATLDDPDANIIAKGGCVLVADVAGDIAGVLALIPQAQGTLELAKMTVSEGFRGAGVARKLMLAAEDAGRKMGATKLWLESNTVLAPAIELYRACGWSELAGDDCAPSPYARCNIQMEKRIA